MPLYCLAYLNVPTRPQAIDREFEFYEFEFFSFLKFYEFYEFFFG